MPAGPVRGRRWADHRRTLEAIAWKCRTRSPWRDLPDGLGSFHTARERLIEWAVDGTWERILPAVMAAAESADDIGRTVSVDSTVCRVHHHAAGVGKRGRRTGPNPTTTHSDAPEAARARRFTSPTAAGRGPWTSASPQARQAMHRPSRPSWPPSVFREAALEGRGPDPMSSWRTARIPPARSGITCGDAGSALPSPQPSDQVGHRRRPRRRLTHRGAAPPGRRAAPLTRTRACPRRSSSRRSP